MQLDIQLFSKTSCCKQLISRQPASEQLKSLWQSGVERGWMVYEGAQNAHTLYETAGPRWLVASVLRELLSVRTKCQLQKAVDLAVGIFHTDIRQCVLHLLTDSLPAILLSTSYSNITLSTIPTFLSYPTLDTPFLIQMQYHQLMEPQLSALSRLTAYCVYLASATYETVATEVRKMLFYVVLVSFL